MQVVNLAIALGIILIAIVLLLFLLLCSCAGVYEKTSAEIDGHNKYKPTTVAANE